MKAIIAGTLALALPGMVAIGLLAAPKPRAAAPVQIPITGQAVDAAGNRVTLSGSVTLTTDTPLPTPTPDPLGLLYLRMEPAIVAPGGSSVVTVMLTRAALLPVQVPLKSADPDGQVAASLTIAAGQDHGTAAVTTASTITREKLIAIVGTYNGQSKSANLTVRPASPVPAPIAGLWPRVDALTAPDGSPLVLPAAPGQQVRVQGQGMGAEAGELWWNGIPMPVVAWSDSEAVGRLPWPSGAMGGVEVRTKAGGFWGGGLVPDEPWSEAPEPPSSRRREVSSQSGCRERAGRTPRYGMCRAAAFPLILPLTETSGPLGGTGRRSPHTDSCPSPRATPKTPRWHQAVRSLQRPVPVTEAVYQPQKRVGVIKKGSLVRRQGDPRALAGGGIGPSLARHKGNS